MKRKKFYYQGIPVKLLTTKTASIGDHLIDIKFPSGVIYACPKELLIIQ